jgi:CTP synthase (UTP-ammonia lyase)
MRNTVTVGLVGDYDQAVPAHQAIPLALQSAADSLGIELAFGWVPTNEISTASRISSFSGIWCVPASPYRNMEGALLAIRHARESRMPFLGTCGGFQHAVIEYARNVLGWKDAEHAETTPDAQRAVIAPLECSLVEARGQVRFSPNSRIATAYQVSDAVEGYRCRYGLNPAFRSALLAGPLRATAEDENGEVRGIELDGHPFFVATLFQPERGALVGKPVPLAIAFLQACAP